MVSKIATALIENGEFKRAYLGVRISDVSDDMSNFYNGKFGALITSIEDGTPADKAGLKRGDLILSVEGKKIKGSSELKNIIGTYEPNATVTLEVLRDGKVITKKVKLMHQTLTFKESGGLGYKGLSVQNLSAMNKQEFGVSANVQGVVVSEVAQDSDAQKAGIMAGDVIVQIENIEIKNVEDFAKATQDEKKKRLYIYRRGGIFAVVL